MLLLVGCWQFGTCNAVLRDFAALHTLQYTSIHWPTARMLHEVCSPCNIPRWNLSGVKIANFNVSRHSPGIDCTDTLKTMIEPISCLSNISAESYVVRVRMSMDLEVFTVPLLGEYNLIASVEGLFCSRA